MRLCVFLNDNKNIKKRGPLNIVRVLFNLFSFNTQKLYMRANCKSFKPSVHNIAWETFHFHHHNI